MNGASNPLPCVICESRKANCVFADVIPESADWWGSAEEEDEHKGSMFDYTLGVIMGLWSAREGLTLDNLYTITCHKCRAIIVRILGQLDEHRAEMLARARAVADDRLGHQSGRPQS